MMPRASLIANGVELFITPGFAGDKTIITPAERHEAKGMGRMVPNAARERMFSALTEVRLGLEERGFPTEVPRILGREDNRSISIQAPVDLVEIAARSTISHGEVATRRIAGMSSAELLLVGHPLGVYGEEQTKYPSHVEILGPMAVRARREGGVGHNGAENDKLTYALAEWLDARGFTPMVPDGYDTASSILLIKGFEFIQVKGAVDQYNQEVLQRLRGGASNDGVFGEGRAGVRMVEVDAPTPSVAAVTTLVDSGGAGGAYVPGRVASHHLRDIGSVLSSARVAIVNATAGAGQAALDRLQHDLDQHMFDYLEKGGEAAARFSMGYRRVATYGAVEGIAIKNEMTGSQIAAVAVGRTFSNNDRPLLLFDFNPVDRPELLPTHEIEPYQTSAKQLSEFLRSQGFSADVGNSINLGTAAAPDLDMGGTMLVSMPCDGNHARAILGGLASGQMGSAVLPEHMLDPICAEGARMLVNKIDPPQRSGPTHRNAL